jgi:hypothetical protein
VVEPVCSYVRLFRVQALAPLMSKCLEPLSSETFIFSYDCNATGLRFIRICEFPNLAPLELGVFWYTLSYDLWREESRRPGLPRRRAPRAREGTGARSKTGYTTTGYTGFCEIPSGESWHHIANRRRRQALEFLSDQVHAATTFGIHWEFNLGN